MPIKKNVKKLRKFVNLIKRGRFNYNYKDLEQEVRKSFIEIMESDKKKEARKQGSRERLREVLCVS